MRYSMLSLSTAALALSLLAAGCSGGTDASRAENRQPGVSAPAAPPAIAVTRVVSRQPERKLRLPGEIIAFQDVAIYPKVQGFVQAILVDRGTKVKKGQVLVQMIAPELLSQREEAEAKSRAAAAQSIEAEASLQSVRSQRLEAEAKLAGDIATYERLKAASAAPGVVAGNDLELAQRSAEAARARVNSWKENENSAAARIRSLQESQKAAADAARASLEIEKYLRVTSPFDGVITERNVHEGSLVGPSGSSQIPMVRIQQVELLRLVVSVPETEVGGIEPGAQVSFGVQTYPGETFVGTVRRIAHVLDQKSRTMPVEMDVPNPSGRLSPGMYAEVVWPSKRAYPSLFVPPAAIAVTTERTFVVRIRNGVAEWVDIRRGSSMGDSIEIFGDLVAGDEVALRGTDELRVGTRVTIRSQ